MQILPESPGDRDAIFTLTQAAFKDHPHSAHTEGHIIDALREAGALTLSLAAWDGDEMVGHVAFSPVAVSDGSRDWYGLGPLAVRPDRQRRGVGAALLQEGLAQGVAHPLGLGQRIRECRKHLVGHAGQHLVGHAGHGVLFVQHHGHARSRSRSGRAHV